MEIDHSVRPEVEASIIIAFYNDIEILEIILRVLNCERNYLFEVIIADDGSNQCAVNALRDIQSGYPFDIVHLWQEDLGFRKPRILNMAVKVARAKVLVFLDGDCVPQSDFLEGHVSGRIKPECRAGRRVDLSHNYFRLLDLIYPQCILRLNASLLLRGALKGDIRHLEKAIAIPGWLTKSVLRKKTSIVGCNFSIDRRLMLSLNGFDARVDYPWGAEDADIERRLRLLGVPIVPMFGRSTVFHFDKNFFGRSQSSGERGWRMFEQVRKEKNATTSHGLNNDNVD